MQPFGTIFGMNRAEAETLARALGAELWQRDEGEYVCAIRRPDGAVVVFDDEGVAEYPDDAAYDAAAPAARIVLRDDPTGYWVIEDAEGTVFLADPDHGRGWPTEEDATHEARGLQSRTGVKCRVRPQRIEDARATGRRA